MIEQFWSVAVDAPIAEPLTYRAPQSDVELSRGQLVEVPLGKRKVKGLLLRSQAQASSAFEIKNIQSIETEFPALPEPFIKWLEWMASYYIYPIGSVAALAYPSLKRTEKQRKSSRPPVIPEMKADSKPQLTPEQQEVINKIIEIKGFGAHLLFGVTGSGKTEVYLRLLEDVLARGKQGLVLVPEISLTPQLVQRFAARFGDQIAVLHSQLTDRERTNQWWDIIEGRKKILIGARSALFCPLNNLGVVIVDEEHEPSFKQEEKLKYHGRDAAIMLAHLHDCPVILGSATPSLESWKNAQDGKFHLHRMRNRVQMRSFPEIQILDLRAQEKNPDLPFWLTTSLHTAIQEILDKKEQVALFLNRRGVAQSILCPDCGFTHECPNCDISLTLHGKSHLVCHYCDYHQDLKLSCPSCKEGQLTALGMGTELLESELGKLFPEARIARADRDEVQSRMEMEELIAKMESGDIDILIGTQMIAKGLDFPKLNLVGLVLADVGFNLPDFRATERSFQLITQVSGRAGRHVKAGEKPGQVIVQTYNPDHPSLVFAQNHDYEGFAAQELQFREPLKYPPLGKLVSYKIQGIHLSKVQGTARLLAQRCTQLKIQNPRYKEIEVLGPAEAPIAKLRGQFRYHLLIKGLDHRVLNAFCHQVLGDQKWLETGTRISVDVDPLHLL